MIGLLILLVVLGVVLFIIPMAVPAFFLYPRGTSVCGCHDSHARETDPVPGNRSTNSSPGSAPTRAKAQ